MLRIVTDGAVDLPAGWQDEFEIHVLPLHVRFGERSFLQGVDINENDFYRMVRETRVIPKTSLPSPGEIAEFYRKVSQPGDQVLSIHVSRKLSGTFATAELAARDIHGEIEVYPFDSGSGSAAMAFMAKAARVMERAGVPISRIIQNLEKMRDRQEVIFTLDNLEFAYLSGRVTVIQNLLSMALKVKPILLVRCGLLEMADRVRTRQRSLERVIEYIYSKVGDMAVNLAVVHANDLTSARAMVERVRQRFNCRDLVMTSLSVPIAAHLGPGAIGIVAIPVEEDE